MNGTCQIVLRVSPELFGRIEARAAEEKSENVKAWVVATVIGALLPPRPEAETRILDELRATKIVREILDGGTRHAPHN